MSTERDNCSTGPCPVDENKEGSKLVKSTDLPLTGNPYPPKDVIQNESPNSLEMAVASTRTAIQPYLSPICAAYERTSDVLSIGMAHSQSAFQNLFDKQNPLTSGLFISGSTIVGFLLARKKGVFKKALYTTTFFTGSAALCFQDAAKKNLDIAWVMAKNNLPALASSQYQKLSGQLSSLSYNQKKQDTTTVKEDKKD